MTVGVNPDLFQQETSPVVQVLPKVAPAAVDTSGKAVPAVNALSHGDTAAQGEAVQAAFNPMREATLIESFGAAASQWDTLNAWNWMKHPDFTPETQFSPYKFLSQVPFQLSEVQQKRLNEAKSSDEAGWLVAQWDEQRSAQRVAAAHPAAAILAGVLDPAYLAVGGGLSLATKGVQTAAAARTIGAIGQGAATAVVSGLASEVQPISTQEFAANILLNMAGGAFISDGKGKLIAADRDLPSHELGLSAKALANDVPLTPVQVEAKVQTLGQKVGEKLAININKTLKQVDDKIVGAEIADLLVDNVLDYTKTSVEAEKRSIHTYLGQTQQSYEDLLRQTMAEQGYGTMKMVAASSETRAAQNAIERQVYAESLRRAQLTRQGRAITFDDVPPRIKELADRVDRNMQRAANEQIAAGMTGAEAIAPTTGYLPRRMSQIKIDDMRAKFMAIGQPEKAAHQSVVRLVKDSIKGAGVQEDQLAYDIASSMIDRALRKGYMEDGAFSSQFGKGTQAQIRDELKRAGVSHQNIERVAEILSGDIDEAGKASHLKHRIDLDYDVRAQVGSEQLGVIDLFETNVATLLETYNHNVAGRAALARKGVKTVSDIQKMRDRYARAVGNADRASKLEVFDGVINDLMGLPTGQKVNETLRNAQGYNRMISLGGAGLWQATEYAPMMQKYGLLKTLRYAMAESPLFKRIMETTATDKVMSSHLKDVLTNMAEQDMRLRPYIAKFEDNFDMPINSRTSLMLQQGGQLVPYVNAMKFIHSHQARLASNLIIDTMSRAAEGNAQARSMLARYGLKEPVMDKIGVNVKQHGLQIDKWSDGTWAAVRPVFAKMMDEAVLHQRLGDVPAFAKFDPVGKFIFTYRGFTLTAHNKILAGSIGREGLHAAALLAMYQFPLALMATQANAAISGKGLLDEGALVAKAMGQMGVLGLGNDLWSWLSGTKREFGAPGLIPFDRAISAAGSLSGYVTGGTSGGKLQGDLMQLLPLVSDIPGYKALGNLAKEN